MKTYGAERPALLLSSISFRSAHQYQNMLKPLVGVSFWPETVIELGTGWLSTNDREMLFGNLLESSTAVRATLRGFPGR